MERKPQRVFEDYGAFRLNSSEAPEIGSTESIRLLGVRNTKRLGQAGFRVGPDPGYQQQASQHEEGRNLFFLGLCYCGYGSIAVKPALDQRRTWGKCS